MPSIFIILWNGGIYMLKRESEQMSPINIHLETFLRYSLTDFRVYRKYRVKVHAECVDI
jgi:hypothetical protein